MKALRRRAIPIAVVAGVIIAFKGFWVVPEILAVVAFFVVLEFIIHRILDWFGFAK